MILHILALVVCRALLPVSFLIALVIAPLEFGRGFMEWPRLLRDMWDDPF